jgi:hypothetical protein
MDVGDTSVLYLLAKRYIDEFPLSKDQVLSEYKAFQSIHIDIVSGVYDANERNCDPSIERIWGDLISAMSEADCWSSREMCNVHTQRLRDFRRECSKWWMKCKKPDQLDTSLVPNESVVRGGSSDRNHSSVISGVVNGSQCTAEVVEVKAMLSVNGDECDTVRYLPEYSKDISCSEKECYNSLYDLCVDNKFILHGESSPLYTTDCWNMLGYNLQRMNPDDISELYVLCKKYFAEHPLPKDRILSEYKVFVTKLYNIISMSNSDAKYSTMNSTHYEWHCTLMAMDWTDGWCGKPEGERQKFINLWSDLEESSTEWLKKRGTVAVQSNPSTVMTVPESSAVKGRTVSVTEVPVVRQGSTVQRKVAKKSSISRSGISLNIGVTSREFKKASNNSLWRQDYLNKIFFGSSDDEEEDGGDSIGSSSSSDYEGGYDSDPESDREDY